MILKEADDRSADLDDLKALLDLPGLARGHRDRIANQISSIRTGDRGERDVAYFLNHSLQESRDTLVIHDLRLEIAGQTAQIDHLVISRYRFAYVLETKSLNASLQCNEAGEWTAWYGPHKRGTPVPISSPIEQARRHADLLRRWLKAKHWTTIQRVEPIVVVSPTTFVGKTRAKGDEAFTIVRSDLFARWWEHERDIGPALGTPWLLATRYSTGQLVELGSMLVADHRPSHRDWRAQLGLPPIASSAQDGTINTSPCPRIADTLDRPRADQTDVLMSKEAIRVADVVKIATPFGSVDLRRVGDGRYAIRHKAEPQLFEHVRPIGQQHGSWQPRYKNWLVSAADVEIVVAKLRQSSC